MVLLRYFSVKSKRINPFITNRDEIDRLVYFLKKYGNSRQNILVIFYDLYYSRKYRKNEEK